MEFVDHFVSVIVKDDGIGFDREKIKQDGKSHIGLKNVSERVKSMCNGSFYVKSEPGQGTIVQLLFPQKSKKIMLITKLYLIVSTICCIFLFCFLEFDIINNRKNSR